MNSVTAHFARETLTNYQLPMKSKRTTGTRFATAVLFFAGFLLVFSSFAANKRASSSPAVSRAKGAPIKVKPAAAPVSGTLSPSGAAVTWNGSATGGASVNESTCVDGVNCDTFTLILSGTPSDWSGQHAHIRITWPEDPSGSIDYDLFVHKGSTTSGPLVGSSATTGPTPEVVDLDPTDPAIGTGTFTVHVVYFTGSNLFQYSGSATSVANASGGGGTPTPTPTPGPSIPPGTPRFFTYMSPQGVADSAGEPSIGSNWTKETTFTNHNVNGSTNSIPNGGSTLYFGGFLPSLLKVTFSDCSSPAGVTWDQKPLLSASTPRAAGDPILFTDHATGRTFVAQLEGLTPAGATIDITDDDGDTFIPSDGVVPSDVDHETLGGGPYHSPLPNGVNPIYPNAVYYASQSVAEARCLRSDTGGLLFSQGSLPMFTAATCDGLHGHVKVSPATAPDAGTVYVPDKGCGTVPLLNGGNAAVAFSEDNGITWTVSEVPDGSAEGEWDPSVGIASDGTIYLGYQDINGHAKIAKGHHTDGGGLPGMGSITWSPSVDVGALVGVNNITFPAVVAGDPDRASFAFFGTTTADCLNCTPVQDHTGGSNDDPSLFTGVWYLYIATTVDGGQTWATQNVTPNDPIQRGPICGGSTCRNLLDFFDATIDKEGRVLVGYDDGCVSANCIGGGNNDYTSKAAIARQTGGKRMFHVFDPTEPAVPGAPLATGALSASGTTATLSWPVPDNGGSTITAYNVYRKMGSGSFSLLATVTVPGYTDPNFAAGDAYHVTALNSSGESPYCPDISPAIVTPPNPCALPGVLAINDNDGDAAPNIPVDGSVNIQQLFVAEPFFGSGSSNNKLVFTLQAAPSLLSSAPPNSQWIIIWNRQGTDPSDPSDSSYDRLYVMMRTDVSGNPTFEYGKFGIPLNEVPPPPPDPNANTPKMIGAVDSGSYDVTTGLIRITVSNDKLRAIDGGPSKYGAGSNLSALNVRTYFNRPDPGQRSQNNASDISPNGSYPLSGNAICAPANLPIISVVSAKTHGSAGEFDIPLPYTGSAATSGIECRSNNNTETFVFSFVNPIASVAGASVSGTATIDNAHTGINTSNPHEYVVSLTGVSNAQHVTVTLTNLSDTAGNTMGSLAATLGVLIGDVNGDGVVDGNDVAAVQAKTRQNPDSTNFKMDVDTTGVIDGNDVSTVQGHTRTSLN
jgi:hypothetical protein